MTQVRVTSYVEDKGVESLLNRMDSTLSPSGLVAFLTGAVVPYLQSRGAARFAGEGDDVVGKWLPLSEATETFRSEAGYGAAHPINKRTGELERYIIGSPGLPVPEPGIGASLTYPGRPPGGELEQKMRTAQMGAPTLEGQMNPTPARPVLGMNERDLMSVVLMLTFYANTGRVK